MFFLPSIGILALIFATGLVVGFCVGYPWGKERERHACQQEEDRGRFFERQCLAQAMSTLFRQLMATQGSNDALQRRLSRGIQVQGKVRGEFVSPYLTRELTFEECGHAAANVSKIHSMSRAMEGHSKATGSSHVYQNRVSDGPSAMGQSPNCQKTLNEQLNAEVRSILSGESVVEEIERAEASRKANRYNGEPKAVCGTNET